MNTFRPGQTVWLELSGELCEIKELLGSGGQGQVYHASMNGQDCALKWYFPHNATDAQRVAVERLVHKGPPNDRFLWPLDIAIFQGHPSFGYLMPLREPRFRGMAELMSRAVDPTFRTLTNMALELADSFLRLHSLGFCYSDISFNNIFFDPVTGEVSICDNDNVTVDGEASGGVLGTPRFMAPEIVREKARPSIGTDLYSLAVILFYMFMVHHPLEGRREKEINCLDLPAMKKLYGTEAPSSSIPSTARIVPSPASTTTPRCSGTCTPATSATSSPAPSPRASTIPAPAFAKANGARSSPGCATRFLLPQMRR